VYLWCTCVIDELWVEEAEYLKHSFDLNLILTLTPTFSVCLSS
jgi:hypothetical protein